MASRPKLCAAVRCTEGGGTFQEHVGGAFLCVMLASSPSCPRSALTALHNLCRGEQWGQGGYAKVAMGSSPNGPCGLLLYGALAPRQTGRRAITLPPAPAPPPPSPQPPSRLSGSPPPPPPLDLRLPPGARPWEDS